MVDGSEERAGDRRALAWGAGLVGALTLLRIAALFATPLQLYPDEAQYWLWSRRLAFGYFSKPPMIAWLIALTTRFGDAEPWVRLSAPLVHAVAALALQRAGRILYDARTGLVAAVVYMLMPGVQLSSGVIATDAPLLMFLSLAVWAYAVLWRTPRAERRGWVAAALGAGLAGAFLSKYAALYVCAGLAAHLIGTRRSLAGPTRRELGLGLAVFVATVSPNLAWNAAHGFATVIHTLDDAHLTQSRPGLLGHLASAAGFAGAQFGVFGPAPLAVLLAAAWSVRRMRSRSASEGIDADHMLLMLTGPALTAVLLEALVARANANWAAAAYAPASVLAAACLARPRARPMLAFTAVSQGAAAALFMAAAVQPSIADALHQGGAFKRARGWREEAAAVNDRLRRSGPLTAVITDQRFHFNALSYYGRKAFAAPGAPPLRIWVRRLRPRSQPEATAPLTPADGARVLVVNAEGDYADEIRRDFARAGPAQPVRMRIGTSAGSERRFDLFLAEGFRPRRRDPVSGLPLPR